MNHCQELNLDSTDLNLIEVGNAVNIQIAPIRLCMCNMHTSLYNESLTLKVGTIQIRQLLRLYPGSWLEAGSISVPELPTNSNILSYACLGGSTNYYTLAQGEQFFKSSFRLSEQSSFGHSLFHPDLHVLHSHFIFEHKYNWTNYEHINRFHDELDDEKIFYLFDFCGHQKESYEQHQNINDLSITTLAQLTTSSQVCQQYFHTRQILPLKSHEESFDNFPLYKFHLSPCWYESKDPSIQRLANRISTHPLLGIRQFNDQTNATWKSLININLPQHSFLKDHKIQNAILFPAVAYLELATAASQQLLFPKEDDQRQPRIIFEDVKFVKVLILNEHELVEVFTQIIMPMRE
ncbi:unnamed protein product [Adineta steineri]|uniref:PKS/mFAS DH domain-containing protein n=1 Tax=Adineta steineri TaxID=433720 RepID=A0A815CIV0_9BILA|nr:unnamed protein product [Adineta steineri]CAF1529689.1 unnamed protein product [Adineta steineri]